MLTPLILAQTAGATGTPIWVILIIVFLILVLFLWGVTNSSGIRGKQAEVDSAHDAAHGHDSTHHEAELEPEPPIEDASVNEFVMEPEPETATAVADTPPTPDDLRKVEGIGPKIQSILNEAGIFTFQQLAASNVETLTKIVIEDGGIRLAHPDTWPEQAKLAAKGDWDALETLQDELVGGKRV